MKLNSILVFCLVGVSSTGAASIFGSAELPDELKFPKIPGINKPIGGFSLFPAASNQNLTSSSNQNSTGSSGSSSVDQALNALLPNVTNWVPVLPLISTNISIPSIEGPGSLDSLPTIPGLSDAITLARNRVRLILNATGSFEEGINSALKQALESNDPTGAVRTLVNSFLDAYLPVAKTCPVVVTATRVLKEGIHLASEVAKSARNVAFGS